MSVLSVHAPFVVRHEHTGAVVGLSIYAVYFVVTAAVGLTFAVHDAWTT